MADVSLQQLLLLLLQKDSKGKVLEGRFPSFELYTHLGREDSLARRQFIGIYYHFEGLFLSIRGLLRAPHRIKGGNGLREAGLSSIPSPDLDIQVLNTPGLFPPGHSWLTFAAALFGQVELGDRTLSSDEKAAYAPYSLREYVASFPPLTNPGQTAPLPFRLEEELDTIHKLGHVDFPNGWTIVLVYNPSPRNQFIKLSIGARILLPTDGPIPQEAQQYFIEIAFPREGDPPEPEPGRHMYTVKEFAAQTNLQLFNRLRYNIPNFIGLHSDAVLDMAKEPTRFLELTDKEEKARENAAELKVKTHVAALRFFDILRAYKTINTEDATRLLSTFVANLFDLQKIDSFFVLTSDLLQSGTLQAYVDSVGIQYSQGSTIQSIEDLIDQHETFLVRKMEGKSSPALRDLNERTLLKLFKQAVDKDGQIGQIPTHWTVVTEDMLLDPSTPLTAITDFARDSIGAIIYKTLHYEGHRAKHLGRSPPLSAETPEQLDFYVRFMLSGGPVDFSEYPVAAAHDTAALQENAAPVEEQVEADLALAEAAEEEGTKPSTSSSPVPHEEVFVPPEFEAKEKPLVITVSKKKAAASAPAAPAEPSLSPEEIAEKRRASRAARKAELERKADEEIQRQQDELAAREEARAAARAAARASRQAEREKEAAAAAAAAQKESEFLDKAVATAAEAAQTLTKFSDKKTHEDKRAWLESFLPRLDFPSPAEAIPVPAEHQSPYTFFREPEVLALRNTVPIEPKDTFSENRFWTRSGTLFDLHDALHETFPTGRGGILLLHQDAGYYPRQPYPDPEKTPGTRFPVVPEHPLFFLIFRLFDLIDKIIFSFNETSSFEHFLVRVFLAILDSAKAAKKISLSPKVYEKIEKEATENKEALERTITSQRGKKLVERYKNLIQIKFNTILKMLNVLLYNLIHDIDTLTKADALPAPTEPLLQVPELLDLEEVKGIKTKEFSSHAQVLAFFYNIPIKLGSFLSLEYDEAQFSDFTLQLSIFWKPMLNKIRAVILSRSVRGLIKKQRAAVGGGEADEVYPIIIYQPTPFVPQEEDLVELFLQGRTHCGLVHTPLAQRLQPLQDYLLFNGDALVVDPNHIEKNFGDHTKEADVKERIEALKEYKALSQTFMAHGSSETDAKRRSYSAAAPYRLTFKLFGPKDAPKLRFSEVCDRFVEDPLDLRKPTCFHLALSLRDSKFIWHPDTQTPNYDQILFAQFLSLITFSGQTWLNQTLISKELTAFKERMGDYESIYLNSEAEWRHALTVLGPAFAEKVSLQTRFAAALVDPVESKRAVAKRLLEERPYTLAFDAFARWMNQEKILIDAGINPPPPNLTKCYLIKANTVLRMDSDALRMSAEQRRNLEIIRKGREQLLSPMLFQLTEMMWAVPPARKLLYSKADSRDPVMILLPYTQKAAENLGGGGGRARGQHRTPRAGRKRYRITRRTKNC